MVEGAAERLLPLRVTVLTAAPTKLPWRTSNGAMLTCTCSIAASEIGATPDVSPGELRRPNELLKYEPSTVMLFRRLSCPANDSVPPDCGVRRVMSFRRPEIVGSVASVSRLSDVAAPVRSELKTASDCAVTVTSSAIDRTMKSRSVATPRLTTMFVLRLRLEGRRLVGPFATVTEYGPPTRMPGIE